MLSAKSTVKPKKARTAAVTLLSAEQTAEVVEESYVTEITDQPQLHTELETSKTAYTGITKKNKSALSEMDSGILVEEVEDDSTVGQAVRRKVSSRGANDKQESSVTRMKPSQTDSSSSNCDAQTSRMKSVTVGSHRNVGTLQEMSTDGSSTVPAMSDSLIARSRGQPSNWAPEFDDSGVKDLSGAKVQSGSLKEEMVLLESRKKSARREVDKQQRCMPSVLRCHMNSNSEVEPAAGGGGGGNDDDDDDDNQIVIVSSDDDEPAFASNHMTPNHSHMDAGNCCFCW